MLDFTKKLFLEYKIELVGAVSLEHCHITRAYKLRDFCTEDFSSLTAIMIAVPYLVKHEKRNISAYAAPKDYHAFFKGLFDAVIPLLEREYPDHRFVGFADDSPIDEIHAAALSGLGIIGDHGMLITEKHSSFIFIAEIITDLVLDTNEKYEIKRCEGCGKCRAACPKNDCGECLSAITQRKGELCEREVDTIKKYGTAWGCDICSEVCPHTRRATANGTIYTDIPFFKTELTPTLTKKLVEDMSDEEFSRRAYSWRKKETILRNLTILEDKNLKR